MFNEVYLNKKKSRNFRMQNMLYGLHAAERGTWYIEHYNTTRNTNNAGLLVGEKYNT